MRSRPAEPCRLSLPTRFCRQGSAEPCPCQRQTWTSSSGRFWPLVPSCRTKSEFVSNSDLRTESEFRLRLRPEDEVGVDLRLRPGGRSQSLVGFGEGKPGRSRSWNSDLRTESEFARTESESAQVGVDRRLRPAGRSQSLVGFRGKSQDGVGVGTPSCRTEFARTESKFRASEPCLRSELRPQDGVGVRQDGVGVRPGRS